MTEMPSDPREWGMTVQQLYDFGVEVYGSDEKLDGCAKEISSYGMGLKSTVSDEANLSMYDVVVQNVKPKTKEANLSLSVFMNQEDPKKAEVFISHSWAEKFALFALVLAIHCLPKPDSVPPQITTETYHKMVGSLFGWADGIVTLMPDTVIWICAFAINQNANIAGELGSDVMESPFAQVLRSCRQVIVVYNPVVDLYSRVWCCLEIYLAVQKEETEPDTFSIKTVGMVPLSVHSAFRDAIGPENRENIKILATEIRQEWQQKTMQGDNDGMFKTDRSKLDSVAEPLVQEFLTDNPVKVEDAQASVESDRIMIMNAIEDNREAVNACVASMREKMMMNAMAMECRS
eukprot:gnl/TRDRNA2_/TRDRNA2_94557_c0_seq1.p1 gnl/TRDRNA2_/TRDRNA2_94557_c0~~gnl/TRDRNA2_/TRDRNA2_94557_c0_seq1.p1  ORF type:complete len:347 (+),score=61.78 gnl/TRDRNA2_/TRDRNA2_94557_c0_seq1:107-1147(+)